MKYLAGDKVEVTDTGLYGCSVGQIVEIKSVDSTHYEVIVPNSTHPIFFSIAHFEGKVKPPPQFHVPWPKFQTYTTPGILKWDLNIPRSEETSKRNPENTMGCECGAWIDKGKHSSWCRLYG